MLTPSGQLPFFIPFLKVLGLSNAFLADCPLDLYQPECADHKRNAHITALRLGPLSLE